MGSAHAVSIQRCAEKKWMGGSLFTFSLFFHYSLFTAKHTAQ